MKGVMESSVELLNQKYPDRKIYCVGCGKRLYELLSLYKTEPFVDHISGLFDNYSKLWGVKIEVGSRMLDIENPVLIKEITNSVLLITSDHFEDVYNSIRGYLSGDNVIVYRYPQYYYQWTSLLLRIVGLFPLRRQILFCAGMEPHENADEIVRYIIEDYKGKKYRIVYLDGDDDLHYREIKCIQSNAVRGKVRFKEVFNYCRLYACSRFLCYENQALKKGNSKQCLIYLNHGTIPIKNVSDVLRQPDEIDVGVCPGKGCANLYVEQYGIALEKQIYMMPARVNRMLRSSGEIHDLLNVKGKRVILWLPTFRQLQGSERQDSECISPIDILEKNLDEVDSYLRNKNMVLAIKKHPRERAELSVSTNIKNICLVNEEQLSNNKLCLQDILKDTDALITDYSSISFEYMLLDKPIGYVLTDINEYHRGFSVDNPEEYMPGEKIYNKNQLLSFIDDVFAGKDKFGSQRRMLINKLFGSNAYKNGAESLIKYLDCR